MCASPGDDSTQEVGVDPTLKDIVAAIQGVQGSLEAKIDTVSVEVTLLRTDLCAMRDKLKEAEGELKFSDTALLKKQVKDLNAITEGMAAKIEDFEGRSRRNNIRVVGVPEKAEGQANRSLY